MMELSELLERNIRITVNLNTPAQAVTLNGQPNGGTQEANDLQKQHAGEQVIIEGSSLGDDFSIDCQIQKIAGQTWPAANIVVYGLGRDLINILSHVNFYTMQVLFNSIIVEAGYNGNYNKIFTGYIIYASPDFNNPSTPFIMQCQGLYMDQVMQAPNYNPQGTVYVKDAIQAIAAKSQTKLSVVTTGIDNLKMNNPVYIGGVSQQLEAIAVDNNLNLQIDNETIYVSPKDQPLNNLESVEVSVDNVLNGYPIIFPGGVIVNMMYNALVQFGQRITLKSTVPLTTGNWYIVEMHYNLSSKHKDFNMIAKCSRFGFLYNGN